MSWIKKLFGLKEKEQPSNKTEETQTEQIKEEKETAQQDTRPILRDNQGEDLMCHLCNNEDNETGEYHPIREGDKRKFAGEIYHKRCLRVLQKAGRKGQLG